MKSTTEFLTRVGPIWVALLVYALVFFSSQVDPNRDANIGGVIAGGLLALAAIFAHSQRIKNLEEEVERLRIANKENREQQSTD